MGDVCEGTSVDKHRRTLLTKVFKGMHTWVGTVIVSTRVLKGLFVICIPWYERDCTYVFLDIKGTVCIPGYEKTCMYIWILKELREFLDIKETLYMYSWVSRGLCVNHDIKGTVCIPGY